MTGLADSFNRPVNYLRVSVTDRCNLRCLYCMPADGISLLSHNEILTYEEIYTIAKAAAALGINKLRLTGGEPLVRKNLSRLISTLAEIEGIDDISLTTNGVLLENIAEELKEAGLKRINISLDSLRSDRYQKITQSDKLEDVFKGIQAARQVGLSPIKTNTVVIRNTNDDEILDFARMTIDEDWHVRFIEYMPFKSNGQDGKLVPVSEMMQVIEDLGELKPTFPEGVGPAKYYRLPSALGTMGFISPVSEHFCKACNRLRLTAEGKLRPCLFSDFEIDLRGPLRNGAGIDELKQLIKEAVSCKPEGHKLKSGITCDRYMTQIGG